MVSQLKKALPPIIYRFLTNKYNGLVNGFSTKSYSQEGEDMILNRIFEKQKKGLYIDVGAHHPRRFSNTFLFYKKGWRGINIDCNPGSMNAFNVSRKGDINLEYAISDCKEVVKYFRFSEPAINGCVEDFHANSRYKTIQVTPVETVTLEYVLDNNLPSQSTIDFLSIDVEGMDLKVLNSNNWTRYRPKIVLVEDIMFNYDYTADSKIVRYMNSVDYVLFAKTVNTFIFREKFFLPS